MRILVITSVAHPQIIHEVEALGKKCDLEYFSVEPPNRANIGKMLKYGLKAFFRRLPIIVPSLIKVGIPPVTLLYPVYVLKASQIIDHIFRKHVKFDIVYTHWLFPAGFIGLIVGRFVRCKLVVTAWGYDIQRLKNVKGYGINHRIAVFSKKVMEKSDAVIVNHRVHKKTAMHLVGTYHKKKIIYIPPAIPDISSLPSNKELPFELKNNSDVIHKSNVILFSPALRPLYGIVEFIKAIPLITSKIDNCFFIIVGEGELKKEAMRIVEEKGLTDKVVFTGRVDHEVMKVLYRSSTLVCDLCYAGQGTTTLEAFCFGKPVIGMATAKKLIEHGKNGFLIKRGDYKALAHYISKLLSANKLREEMSKNARKSFKKFNMQVRIDRLIEIFNKLQD